MRPTRFNYANIVATLALIVALGGSAVAAGYLITSTNQIKPSVLKQLRGKRVAPAVYKRTHHDFKGVVTKAPTPDFDQVRTLGTFVKDNAATVIKVTWQSHVRTEGAEGFCHWQIRVDGKDTTGNPNVNADYGAVAVLYSSGAISDAPVNAQGWFPGLAAGSHGVSLWLRGIAASCTTNYFNFIEQVEIEEIAP